MSIPNTERNLNASQNEIAERSLPGRGQAFAPLVEKLVPSSRKTVFANSRFQTKLSLDRSAVGYK